MGSRHGRKIAQILARRARLYAGGSRQFHVKGVQGLLRRIGNQIKICICSASEDKRASRKSQWLNMQWDKETAIGSP
jgi:hypothetical protein